MRAPRYETSGPDSEQRIHNPSQIVQGGGQMEEQNSNSLDNGQSAPFQIESKVRLGIPGTPVPTEHDIHVVAPYPTPAPDDAEGNSAQSLLDLLAEKDRKLELHDTWLKLDLRQTGNMFWDYDLETNRLRVFAHEAPFGVRVTVLENFPESAIANGDVHIDSFEPLRALTANMHAGVSEGGGTFLVADRRNGGYVWSSTSYRLIEDADGTPRRAVGVREDKVTRLTSMFSNQVHEPVPENIMAHLFCYVQYSVDTDAIDFMLYQGIDQTGAYQGTSYDKLVESFADMLFSKSEEAAFRKQLNRERLLEEYRVGRRWCAERYRVVDRNGIIRNLFLAVNVRKSVKTGHVLFLIYMSGVEARAQWEIKSSLGLTREKVTGLYPKEIASGLVKALTSGASEFSRSAVILFKFQGLPELDQTDPVGADNLRHDAPLALAVFLDSDSILYEFSRDCLVAVIPEVGSPLEARQRVELAMTAARGSHENGVSAPRIAVIAGVVCGRTLNMDLEASTARARALCDEHGNAAADVVIVHCEEDDRLPLPADGDATVVQNDDDTLESTSAWEYVESLESILSQDSPGAAVNTTLACLGRHYSADRAYVLSVTESDQLVSILFEWSFNIGSTIQRSFTGMSLDRFPLIKRHIHADSPVLVSRPGAMTGSMYYADNNAWHYAIVPIARSSAHTMVLCLENPRTNLSRWEFAERLAPHIQHQWSLLSQAPAQRAPLFAGVELLPDALSFERDAEAIEATECTSLGVAMVDIPQVGRLVSQNGFSHVLCLATAVEDVMRAVFGVEHLFHTNDTEISALVPNATYDAFIKRCARMRTMLLNQCGGGFRMGTSWSCEPFNALRVVSEARYVKERDDGALAESDSPAVNAPSRSASRTAPTPALSAALSGMGDHFDVYLQPKVDMRTGTLVGAEALARVVDASGNAVTPLAAIERMEQSGDIRELDYFVFDRALSLMNSWQEKGLLVVPLSSNFSRSTIASSSALASVLAIMSRYPDIDPSLIEMEVTETAGDLGKDTLSRLVDKFRETGMRVALDDFGAHYSNASVLANTQFDAVKLDRALINDVVTNDTVRTLVRSVVDVCNHRNMDCIAEGIETLDQANTLIDEGCFVCQGYYYDRPLPADAFERKYLLGSMVN